MSITDQFWQYAKEAMLSACYAKTDDDKQALLDLARTWTQAALLERQSINYDGLAALIGPARHASGCPLFHFDQITFVTR
jgi:hypothetical protein